MIIFMSYHLYNYENYMLTKIRLKNKIRLNFLLIKLFMKIRCKLKFMELNSNLNRDKLFS